MPPQSRGCCSRRATATARPSTGSSRSSTTSCGRWRTRASGALAHEAWLKLVDQTRVAWQNRAHFFAVAARAMRRILVNHAEARRAARRGGGAVHQPLDAHLEAAGVQRDDELLALDEALERLAVFNERGARVVEYHFFGGLTWEEIAETMELSPVTVRRAWAAARGWLRRELGEAQGADAVP